MKNFVPDIDSNPAAFEFLRNYSGRGFFSFLFFVFVGTTATIVLQSSSATMAITITMAFFGWVDLNSAACMILGENIGTTLTAYLASLNTNVTARRAARAHTLFNIIGVLWMIALLPFFLSVIQRIIPGPTESAALIPARLALFHTTFNIVNTVLFLPFIGPFSRFVAFIVKPRKNEEFSRYRLTYRQTGPRQAPEINILKAEREIKKMAELSELLFSGAMDAVLVSPKKPHDVEHELETQEDLLAVMYEEISQFLVHCSKENITTRALERLNQLIRICNEMESIGDCCRKLTACAIQKAEKHIEFDVQGEEEIRTYSDLVKKFLSFNKERLGTSMAAGELMEAEALENNIDKTRDILRKAAQKRLNAKSSDVKTEILFIDMLRHIEHVGDHSFEISRSLYRMSSGRTFASPAFPILPFG